MGYLDNGQITVDAVLTKKGREILSSANGSLNISHFTLSDTGIDYRLWNADHPSGSAYYGEAIENLPQIEALPNSQYAVRNKLVTLPINTKSMPVLEPNITDMHTFTTTTPLAVTVQLIGFSGNEVQSTSSGGGGSSGLHVLVPDDGVIKIDKGRRYDVTGNAMSFIYDQGIAQAAVYEILEGGSTHTFNVIPTQNLESADGNGTKMRLTIIDIRTGTYTEIEVRVNDNLQPRQEKLRRKQN